MVVTKLSQKEWAYLVERGLRKQKVEKLRNQHQNQQEHFWQFINKYRPIPIVIGAAACVEVIKLWGWNDLLHMLFSWVIGIVVVTTFVAGVLHPNHPSVLKK